MKTPKRRKPPRPETMGVRLTALAQEVSLELARLRNEVDRLTRENERLKAELAAKPAQGAQQTLF